MDDRAFALAEGFISASYIQTGKEALHANERVIRSILAQRRCPDEGMSDVAIEWLLHQLALMDTNNFPAHVGAGEREGRVAAPLVARRHYGFAHGIGRSGDILSDQPKSAGSSLMHKVTNCMILDLLRLAGAPSIESAVVFPMATGMTLALVLRAVSMQQQLRNKRREEKQSKIGLSKDAGEWTPRYVIWNRIDQKTALKCIEVAGFIPEVVELRQAPFLRSHKNTKEQKKDNNGLLHPFFLQVHVDDIASAIGRAGGPENIVCVLSTTSCFAPRLPDDVVAVAKLCKILNIPHVVNNAYGIQSRVIMRRLDAAIRLGRVDAMVQSGDKNFLVPVGGAVLSGSKEVVAQASELYAGRASISPILDLFITSLSLGRSGFQRLWDARYKVRERLESELRNFALARGEVLLEEHEETATATATVPEATKESPCSTCISPRNDISFAVTMRTIGAASRAKAIGAHLFRSAVTGPRVIAPDSTPKQLCGHSFCNYGMHTSVFASCPLLVIACGVGMTVEEVCGMMERLEALWPAPTVTEKNTPRALTTAAPSMGSLTEMLSNDCTCCGDRNHNHHHHVDGCGKKEADDTGVSEEKEEDEDCNN